MRVASVQEDFSKLTLNSSVQEQTIEKLNGYLSILNIGEMKPFFQTLDRTGKLNETCLNGTEYQKELDQLSFLYRDQGFLTVCQKTSRSVLWYISPDGDLYAFIKLKMNKIFNCTLQLKYSLEWLSEMVFHKVSFAAPFLSHTFIHWGDLIDLEHFQILLDGGTVSVGVSHLIRGFGVGCPPYDSTRVFRKEDFTLALDLSV